MPTRSSILSARSDSPEYHDLLRLIADGQATVVGRRFEDGGVIVLSAARLARKNPELRAIGIGREFFLSALRDYEDWPVKWWREAIQNAVDAGARNVEIDCRVQADGSKIVVCEDDGRGMDEETLLDKFLVLGGTTKLTGETAGGFGKAKELLLLPWLSWSVRSGTIEAHGSGINYQVERGLPPLGGTVLTVVMPADCCTSTTDAIEYLQRSNLPRVRFSFQRGSLNVKWLTPGHLVEEIEGKASIYHNKRSSVCEGYILVRSKGLYMHSIYVSSRIKGTVLVELTGKPTDLLTANRDSLRDRELRLRIQSLAAQMSADVKSALKKRTKLIRRKYVGSGKFKAEIEQNRVDLLERIGPLPVVEAGEPLSVDEPTIGGIVEMIKQIGQSKESRVIDAPPPELVQAALSGPIDGQRRLEAVAKQLVWQPDFLLMNEIEDYTVPRKFFPESMTPAVQALAKVWAELCRWVFIQLGSEAEYGVGFLFDDSSAAAYHRDEDGDRWLLLNPFKSLGERKEIWNKTSRPDLKWLYAAAIHEVTHMANGLDYHDEAFASALTNNIAYCSDGFKESVKIAKGIAMRPQRMGKSFSRRQDTGTDKRELIEIDEPVRVGDIRWMNTRSLEDWYKGQPDEIFRPVKVLDVYPWDQYQRVSVLILAGPEKGRKVGSLSPSQLRLISRVPYAEEEE